MRKGLYANESGGLVYMNAQLQCDEICFFVQLSFTLNTVNLLKHEFMTIQLFMYYAQSYFKVINGHEQVHLSFLLYLIVIFVLDS